MRKIIPELSPNIPPNQVLQGNPVTNVYQSVRPSRHVYMRPINYWTSKVSNEYLWFLISLLELLLYQTKVIIINGMRHSGASLFIGK